MKALLDIQRELRELLPEGIEPTILAAKNWLDEKSDSYRELLLIEARHREIQRELLDGTLTNDDARVEFNRLSKAILLFIDGLKEGSRSGGPAPGSGSPDLKNGEILYRIPEKMVVEKEVKCLVRAAFDRAVILEDWQMQPGDILLDKRIADVMGVQLLDATESGAFSIRTITDQVQYLDQDLYTEWVFYVKALKEGHFPLVLKVAVIEMRNGVERKRDIILEEIVQITTSADDQKEGDGPLKSSGQAFQLGGGAAEISAPPRPSPSIPQPAPAPGSPAPQSGGGSMLKRLAGTVGMLALLVIATFALSKYWTENGPGNLAQKDVEGSDWQAAKSRNAHRDFDDFLKKYPTSSRADSARQLMSGIEDDEWLAASTSGDSLNVRQFATDFPGSIHATSATAMLKKWETERAELARLNAPTENRAGASSSNNDKPKDKPVKQKDKPDKNNKPSKIGSSVGSKTETENQPTGQPTMVEDVNKPVPMRSVARLPIFPKCDDSDLERETKCTEKEIRRLVGKHLRYPQTAIDAGLTGTVKVGFVVERDGSISGVKAQNSLGKGCDEEAERVVRQLPRFKPGQNAAGQPVRVLYLLPIRFATD